MQSSTLTQPRTDSFWQRLVSVTLPQPYSWRGGMKLKGFKELSNQVPIRPAEIHRICLAIPLEQGRARCRPCVEPGQRVRKGEVIGVGEPNHPWVHASTSGVVESVGLAQIADAPEPQMVVYLQADGLDEWTKRDQSDPPQNIGDLAQYALQMGLVGLGGAGFPTGIKLASARQPDLLLINGAECEPFLTCDDRLMQERAQALIASADYLASVTGVTQTRFGIEQNKPQAIEALRQASRQAATEIEVCTLPARYPAGGQPMLIKRLSGRNLAPGMLPADIGVLVLNVATLYALGRAVFQGEPLISRIITLTGECTQPGNLEVPIGYPVRELARQAGANPDRQSTQVGGPMMGKPLPSPDAHIGKTTSCLIFGAERYLSEKPAGTDCIRCTNCIDVCPMSLRPLDLYDAAVNDDHRRLEKLDLKACIECGCCSSVCPSHLPLRDSFRDAKAAVRRVEQVR